MICLPGRKQPESRKYITTIGNYLGTYGLQVQIAEQNEPKKFLSCRRAKGGSRKQKSGSAATVPLLR